MIEFRDGQRIPQIGLGVWQTPNDTAVLVVEAALRTGYRHVDTAAIYANEQGVGEGLKASGVAREQIFVTTKLWNDEQGLDSTLRACEQSLKKLGSDYVDLSLIHWPSPQRGLLILFKTRLANRAKS